ncbi:triacylglycerol lipase 2-like [Senna tora]|uniref:Triacylglycerol lipase 2-like n=1 Tax=Senna tora TaxID=362788 RepID=A0A834U0P6_9FABA|nr:triacylglycerol lipase 2-like [Senna tora]
MAKTLPSIILVITILFSGLILAATRRTKLVSAITTTTTALAISPSDDGICSSMVKSQGYACEEHLVTTQDGYILSMQRIPVGQSRGSLGNRPPILLQHGLFMDGITWLLLPPSRSLAFLLADNGFDVWLANTRGTKYSHKHTSLAPNDSAYWDWSWDELVAYDLPSTFQYVHQQTRQKLHYIGHSQGTLIALAAFSKYQLSNMLRSAALLSPIAYVSQMTSPLARNAAENFIAESLYKLGIFEFDLRGGAVVNFLRDLCKKPGIDCTNLLTSFTGPNCCLNPSIVNIFLDHEPQSTATKNMIHLSQTTLNTGSGQNTKLFPQNTTTIKKTAQHYQQQNTNTVSQAAWEASQYALFFRPDPEPNSDDSLYPCYLLLPSTKFDGFVTMAAKLQLFSLGSFEVGGKVKFNHMAIAVIRQGTIAMYDYENDEENTKHYGRPSPPVYDIARIPNNVPLFVSYGGADALSDVKDVRRLLEILKDHEGDKLVVQYRDDYAHADYVMGQNAKKDVYDPLISFLRLQ